MMGCSTSRVNYHRLIKPHGSLGAHQAVEVTGVPGAKFCVPLGFIIF